MNRVKLRFFAKKRVKHYFLFFEKITLSSYDLFTVLIFAHTIAKTRSTFV